MAAKAATHGHALCTSLVLAAWRGQEARALELMNAGIEDATIETEGKAVALAGYARAILYIGLGRYASALAAARRACEDADLRLFPWALCELIEAATRSGNRDVDLGVLGPLAARPELADSRCKHGVLALAAALLGDGEIVEASYVKALDRFGGAAPALRVARAQLLYGEWLRRAGRRVDARTQLRAAQAVFAGAGAEGFAERALRELLATGETVRKRALETRDDLTPQEAQIARFAADGRSNREIGAQLFLSPRTVEWHLRKVFRKLQVESRRGLRLALQNGRPPGTLTGVEARDGWA